MPQSNRIQALFAFFAFMAFQTGLFAEDSDRQPSVSPPADEKARVDFIILWAESGQITTVNAVRGMVTASLSSEDVMRGLKEMPDNSRVLLCFPSSTEAAEAHKIRAQIIGAKPALSSIKVITLPRPVGGPGKK